MSDYRERIFDVLRRDAYEGRADAYTAFGVIRELELETAGTDEYIPSADVRRDLTAMLRDGIVENAGKMRGATLYVINIQSRKYSWNDLVLFQKYFPKAFRPIMKKQNSSGGADALLSYIERARREEARQNGESYAGLGGITDAPIFRGRR